MTSPVIIVHGGAGKYTYTVTGQEQLLDAAYKGVKDAARAGYDVLAVGGSALDAVQAAVCSLEDNPYFNAGYGSVMTSSGDIEMDAGIMCGKTLKAGAVACVNNIKNPILLAREVLENTKHVLLVGKGASQFAEEIGMKTVPKESLITEKAIKRLGCFSAFGSTADDRIREMVGGGQSDSGHDTVGAVALDKDGNVAYANSTGGISNKRPGRVGDSPVIGAGGYADNEVGAVTSTGHGESMAKVCLCYRIHMLMSDGLSPDEAAKKGLKHMVNKVQGDGGVIVLNTKGDVSTAFNTEKMAWAWVRDNVMHFGLNPGEDIVESIGDR